MYAVGGAPPAPESAVTSATSSTAAHESAAATAATISLLSVLNPITGWGTEVHSPPRPRGKALERHGDAFGPTAAWPDTAAAIQEEGRAGTRTDLQRGRSGMVTPTEHKYSSLETAVLELRKIEPGPGAPQGRAPWRAAPTGSKERDAARLAADHSLNLATPLSSAPSMVPVKRGAQAADEKWQAMVKWQKEKYERREKQKAEEDAKKMEAEEALVQTSRKRIEPQQQGDLYTRLATTDRRGKPLKRGSTATRTTPYEQSMRRGGNSSTGTDVTRRRRAPMRKAKSNPSSPTTSKDRFDDPAATDNAETPSFVARLCDTREYTGAHKMRFDASGKGRGIRGRRDSVAPVHDMAAFMRSGLQTTGQVQLSGRLGSPVADAAIKAVAEEGDPPSPESRLKHKFRALSYTAMGQDPKVLLRSFDKDRSGALDLQEFISAARKGAGMTREEMSDLELRNLFRAVDSDGSGSMSIDELVTFVWGADGQTVVSAAQGGVAEQKQLIAQDCQLRAQVERARRKLQGLSYGTSGQDPALLLRRYDRDKNGKLDHQEFTMAIRKGGQMSKSDVTDTELRELFRAADVDGDGVLSINELTAFVWGALPVTDILTAETTPETANTDTDTGAGSVTEAHDPSRPAAKDSDALLRTGTSSSFSLPIYRMNTVVQELKLRQGHTEAKEGDGRTHKVKQEDGQRTHGVSDGGQLAYLSAEQALDALQSEMDANFTDLLATVTSRPEAASETAETETQATKDAKLDNLLATVSSIPDTGLEAVVETDLDQDQEPEVGSAEELEPEPEPQAEVEPAAAETETEAQTQTQTQAAGTPVKPPRPSKAAVPAAELDTKATPEPLESPAHPSAEPEAVQPGSNAEVQRKHVVLEFLSTETTYRNGLRCLKLEWIDQLRFKCSQKEREAEKEHGQANKQRRPSMRRMSRGGGGSNAAAAAAATAAVASSAGATAHREKTERAPHGFPDKQDIDKLFSNVESLLVLSEQLLSMLGERIGTEPPGSQWSPHQKIGDLFVTLGPYFTSSYKQCLLRSICTACLPACLPACLSVCLSGWLAGWLAGWMHNGWMPGSARARACVLHICISVAGMWRISTTRMLTSPPCAVLTPSNILQSLLSASLFLSVRLCLCLSVCVSLSL